MLLTLALVVLCSAIIVFFSQEFSGFLKKIFSIPGVKIFLPLALASLIVEAYEAWGYWFLFRFQVAFHQIIYKLAMMMPFKTGALAFARFLILFLLAGLPIWIAKLRAQQKGRRHPQPFVYHVSLMLWLIGVILVVIVP